MNILELLSMAFSNRLIPLRNLRKIDSFIGLILKFLLSQLLFVVVNNTLSIKKSSVVSLLSLLSLLFSLQPLKLILKRVELIQGLLKLGLTL